MALSGGPELQEIPSISDLAIVIAPFGPYFPLHYSTDNGGSPGTPRGSISLDGTVEFVYVGRDPSVNPLGDFMTLVPTFDFKGMFNGKTFEVKQNPGMASMGTTSMLEFTSTPPILYIVSSTLEFFGEFSISGGLFMTAPGKTATLTSAGTRIVGSGGRTADRPARDAETTASRSTPLNVM